MRPFKFFNGRVTARDVASWDFFQDYDGPIGEHRIEIEWCNSFLDFLAKFDENETVLIDTIRMPDGPDLNIDIGHHNYDFWWEDFIAHTGRVRVTWLNFNII